MLDAAGAGHATLVGHSLGAGVIRHVQRLHPERVRALVLVDGRIQLLGTPESLEAFVAPFRGPEFPLALERFVEVLEPGDDRRRLREWIFTEAMRTPRHVAVSALERSLDPELFPETSIPVPVLAIRARAFLGSTEEAFVRRVAPDLRWIVWEDAGHFPMLERPEAFAAELLGFLRQL